MEKPTSKFKYMWRAVFDKRTIVQHPQDLYSKHNPAASWNPSSFRDFQDYMEKGTGTLQKFELIAERNIYWIDLQDASHPQIWGLERGKYGSIKKTLLHKEKRPLSNVRIIYYRQMTATIKDGQMSEPEVLSYVLGYQGLDKDGNNRQKKIVVV